MIAARGDHNETVQTLIAASADLNIQTVKVLLATFVYCYMQARSQGGSGGSIEPPF